MKLVLSILFFSSLSFSQITTSSYYAFQAVGSCRALINNGATPSSQTPVMSKLDSALGNMLNANAVQFGITVQNGFPIPAPSTTDPSGYITSQLSSALSYLNQAAALTTDSGTLSNINYSKIYLGKVVVNPQVTNSMILFHLFSSGYDIGQEEPLTLTDIARNDSSSLNLLEGLWEGIENVRNGIFMAWGHYLGETEFPLASTRGGFDCTTQNMQCAADILLSNTDHGLPYYFVAEMASFSQASMSNADAVNTLLFHPRAWSQSDEAGFEILKGLL